jgi:hypothetical protein
LEILGWGGSFGYETMGPKWIGEINGSHLFGVLFMMGFPERQVTFITAKEKQPKKREKQ